MEANIPARKVTDDVVVAVDPQYFAFNRLWAREDCGLDSNIRPATHNAGGVRRRRPIEPDDNMISDCNVIAHCPRLEIYPHVPAGEIPDHIGIGIHSSHIALDDLPAGGQGQIAVPLLI